MPNLIQNKNIMVPVGTSNSQRYLKPSSSLKPLIKYEVIKPLPAMSGKMAPWFGEPGGGIQFKFNQRVKNLEQKGFMKQIKK